MSQELDPNEHLQRGGRFREEDTEPIAVGAEDEHKVVPLKAFGDPQLAGDLYLPPRFSDGLAQSLARMRARAEKRERPLPVPWPGLAAQLGGGLWPGTFTMVTGTTGAGKTAFGFQLAHHVARQGFPVAYVALELDLLGMHARGLSLAAKDNLSPKDAPRWSELYLGEDLGALERVKDLAEKLAELPFHLELGEPEGWDYRNLVPLAKGMRQAYAERPMLIVLDFLQLVDGFGEDDRELRLRMKRAAYLGRAIAKNASLDTAVLFLSATSRENYGILEGEDEDERVAKKRGRQPFILGKSNPARLVGSSKESGDLEYAGDTVLVLARERWEERPPPDGLHVWVAVAKVRAKARGAGARAGWVELRFDGSCFGEPAKSSAEVGDREWRE